MSKLEERESRRKSIIGGIVGEPDTTAASKGSRGRPKSEGRELKKRISLSVLPSLYEDVQKIAFVQRRSLSELVGEQLEMYRAAHQKELAKFDEIKK